MLAERAYRVFLRHLAFCVECKTVGGEWADPADLCPVGRSLLRAWERAEQVEARAE